MIPISAAVAVMALLAGCKGKTDKAPGNEPVPVRVMQVEDVPGVGFRTYVGTVAPSKSSVLSSSYGGTLLTLRVSEGDKVMQGDTIGVVESQSVQSAWKLAHATLQQAEDGYRRVSQVHGSGSVADVKMVEIETQLSKARASAEAADKALEDCTVKAPYDGVVGDVFTEQGVELSPMTPLIRLLDISSVKIEISVPEGEYSAHAEGDVASVSVPALDGRTFTARLRTKGLTASAVSHAYRFVLEPVGQIAGLMPGMVCNVAFETSGTGIVIPASVVRTDATGRYVWTVQDGKVRKTYVVQDGFSGDGVVIASGLSSGDKVIVEGVQKVSGGMSVREIE